MIVNSDINTELLKRGDCLATYHKDLPVYFIHFEKVFYRVQHNKMMQILELGM